jgi:hypothetical protein
MILLKKPYARYDEMNNTPISLEYALELYEGGLHDLIQQELTEIASSIDKHNQQIKDLKGQLKKAELLGIKACPPRDR